MTLKKLVYLFYFFCSIPIIQGFRACINDMSGIGKEEVVVNRKKAKSENARQKDFSSRKVWLSRWLKHLCIWGSLSHLFIDIFSK